jgi:hypothetical protein
MGVFIQVEYNQHIQQLHVSALSPSASSPLQAETFGLMLATRLAEILKIQDPHFTDCSMLALAASGRHRRRRRNFTLPILGQQKGNAHNYSPTLHLSTEASMALKSLASLHTSASARILRITDPEEGVAPKHNIVAVSPQAPAYKSNACPKVSQIVLSPCQDRNQSTNVASCVGR